MAQAAAEDTLASARRRTFDAVPPPELPTTMADSLFTFPCPCCGKLVEVDTRSGKARAVRPQDKLGAKNLDQLFAAQTKEQQRLGNLFDQAAEDQRRERERLEQQLQRAKQDAQKHPQERPRNPFDLE